MSHTKTTSKITTILSIFAGRQPYMRILMKYVACLIRRGLVDECHVWDYSRNMADYKYLLEECSAHPDREGIQLMGVRNKRSWREYYDYYAAKYEGREDVVLIKCDDDVVYIDVDAFPVFIQHRLAHPEVLFTFGTTINNGLVAHLQQRQGHHANGEYPTDRHRLGHPKSATCPFEFELRVDGFEDLVGDGGKAAWLHEWFLKSLKGRTHASVQHDESKVSVIPLGQRISINFFAVLSKDLCLFSPAEGISDDEKYLSQTLPLLVGRPNCIYTDMTVSHFAFGPQRETGLGGELETELLARYNAIADDLEL